MSYPILAPSSTWYTQGGTATARSTFTQVNIVDSYTPTGNETESWDASAAKDGSITVYVEGTTLTIAGNGSGKISLSADASYTFSYPITGTSQTNLLFINTSIINGAELLDTSNVTTMLNMFAHIPKLSFVNVSNWDTSNVQNMKYLFGVNSALGNSSLASLNLSNWNVGNCTTFERMFSNCTCLKSLDLSNWDAKYVTTTKYMFYNCSGLISLNASNWNTSSVGNMDYMFQNCTSLVNLDVSGWDTSKVTTSGDMFGSCTSLEMLDLSSFHTPVWNNMSRLFKGCHNLRELDISNFDTNNSYYLGNMFAELYSLEKIKLGAGFNFYGSDTEITDRQISLPTPDQAYITGADGKWYTVSGTPYLPAEIPNKTANTYYASIDIVKNLDVKLKNGTIIDIATQIKEKTGKADNIKPADMANEIAGIENGSIDTCSLTISGDYLFVCNSISGEDIVGTVVEDPQNEVLTVPCSSLVIVYDWTGILGVKSPSQLDNLTITYEELSHIFYVFQVSSVANSDCKLIF